MVTEKVLQVAAEKNLSVWHVHALNGDGSSEQLSTATEYIGLCWVQQDVCRHMSITYLGYRTECRVVLPGDSAIQNVPYMHVSFP
jgi:hypothetical protein